MAQEAHNNQKLTIGVLYGFRALLVLFICNYHFWQQSWLAQQVTVAGKVIGFDFITRSSYIIVDGLLLLSGFLLYLPHAQAAEYGTPAPDTRDFYWKRFMRIVPSYLFAVLLTFFAVALPEGAYSNAGAAIADLSAHLTFSFTFFKSTYLYTPINGVLWTIGIEVQFYLIFPLIVRFMRKKPALTLTLMAAAGLIFRAALGLTTTNLSILVNQLPSFLDVYALGMLGAILYIRLRRRTERKKYGAIAAAFSVPLFGLGIVGLLAVLRYQSSSGMNGMDALHLSQWVMRLPLALVMLTLILSASFMPRLLQKLLDNRLMRFLATISLNLYIWHQLLSVRVVKPFFPDTLHDDYPMQIAYTMLCYSLSILTAMAFTYGLEHPAAKWIQKLRSRKGERNHEGSTA